MNLNDIEEALLYLANTDEIHAQLTAAQESMKDTEKHIKGKSVMESELSVSKAEHNFYASKEFIEFLKVKKDSLKALQDCKNKRQTAIYKIEVWRTLEASRRKGNV